MAPAKLIYKRKTTYSDGTVVEMAIWELPDRSDERPHGLKYRLHCSKIDGSLIVRYDNESGKGDHRHYRDKEVAYQFKDVETLIADFLRDIAAERRRKG
jgi:hypothetical protein